MFLHVLKYRLLAIVRDHQTIFWMALFPIILTTIMRLVMGGLVNETGFDTIHAAFLKNEHYAVQPALQQTIDAVNNSDDQLFLFTLLDSKAEADMQLSEGEISGYFVPQANYGLSLHVAKSDMDQTILGEFLQSYTSQAKLIADLFQTNPLRAMALTAAGPIAPDTAFEPIDPEQNVTNPWGSMFFAQIAMTALYCSLQAVTEGSAIDPSVTTVGIRQRTMPQHHLGIVLSSFTAVLLVCIVNMALYLSFSQFVLGLDFGLTTYPLHTVLLAFSGIAAGISLGFFLAAWVPGKRNRHGAAIGVSMIMVFLAGMMVLQIRQLVRTTVPFLKYLNPADMITDGFYALLYYGDTQRANGNALLLVLFTAVSLSLTYVRLRRTRYDHL